MNKLMLADVAIVALLLGACKQNTQEVGPDLTTPLAGQFSGTYFIDNYTSSQPNSVTGSSASVQFERKDNNTLTVEVKINDGLTQVNDRFDAEINQLSLVEEGRSPVAGLRSRYQFNITNLNNRGSCSSHLNLYDSGRIEGGLVYIDSSGKLIGLVFLP
jgi:hypothetical protein